MAANWMVVFAWYVIGVGVLYSIGNAPFVVATYAINTWASILHCAYDALMWRVRDPETARLFGIETSAAEPAATMSPAVEKKPAVGPATW